MADPMEPKIPDESGNQSPIASDQAQIKAPTGPVIVVGGGFGGLYTALALADRSNHPAILLVEPNPRFLFLPLLYELFSGEMRSWEIAPRYDELLAGKGVAWLQDRVERIDASDHRVHTAAGRSLAYSRLVLATGGISHSFAIPGVEEHALGFRSLDDVERLQQLMAQLRERRDPEQCIAVVGAGHSGVELACKLADRLDGAGRVELIEQGPELMPQARAFNREQAGRALQRRGVQLRCRTAVREVGPHTICIEAVAEGDGVADGGRQTLPVAAVLWTAGSRCQAPPINPEPIRDGQGRLQCHADLSVAGVPDLFALGDAASATSTDAEGTQLPATAQVAFQQAELVARNLIHSLASEPLEPFHWNDLGEMVSLGLGDASLTSGGITLAGPAAYQIRRLAYLARMPGRAHQLRVAAGWLADWS
ncbi:MAG: NAD(P)/FAD-dependent oxidoreductase [Prochlorococcaceae cyanobacterium]